MKRLFLAAILIMAMATTTMAADVDLSWDASNDATGYKVYQSADLGATWSVGFDVGNVTTYLMTGVADTGIILFRVSAYNANGEAVRYDAGVFYCGDCEPPPSPSGIGVR